MTNLLRRLIDGERFKPVAKECPKCGADFTQFPATVPTATLVKYMRDAEYGERLMVTCFRCGFRFPEPTVDNRPR